ncbi:MAG: hypothetical protein ORN51_14180 [Akkermansiaceae bacterium]|nr:hypothetical protein [Akkermansiaceae bacterium]
MANAQWKTTTYTLKGGWNAIYLTGDATYDTIDNLLPTTVLEVWRWQTNPTQAGFTESPLIPSAGTPEWSVWKRGAPAESALSQLVGQTAYLVKCSGTSSTSYSVMLKQSPLPATNSWVRNGANLLGFPSYKNGSTYPTISSYFTSFSAAIAANTKVFKYVGGDLGPSNPVQIFSTATDRLDATQAYWFSAEVTGSYVSPFEIGVDSSDQELSFGMNTNVITMKIRNRTASNVSLTLTPTASESAPDTQTAITGAVPLTQRVFNATTAAWTETPLTAATTVSIGASSTVELSFGVNRADPTMVAATSSDALFASFLRITDSGNLVDILIPASANKTSLAGLWMGDIRVSSVGSRVVNGARASAQVQGGGVTSLSVVGSGGYAYTTAPSVSIAAPPSLGNINAIATAAIADKQVSAVTVTNPGTGYEMTPYVTVTAPSIASVQATATAMFNSTSKLVTGLTVTNAGENYVAPPAVTISPPNLVATTGTIISVLTSAGTLNYTGRGVAGSNYLSVPTLTFEPPPAAIQATANATINSATGLLTGFTVTKGGTNYNYATPTVTIDAPPLPTAATAGALVNAAGNVQSIGVGVAGVNYTTAPAVTVAAPEASVQATATAVLDTTLGSAGKISAINVGTAGSFYSSAGVTIAAPPASIVPVAVATVTGDSLSSIAVTTAGNNFTAAPTVTVAAPPASVTATASSAIASGGVTGLTPVLPGSYYRVAPAVTIAAPTDSTATGTASLSAGAVSGITVGQSGGYYATAPAVTVSAPASSVTAVAGTATVGGGTVVSIPVATAGSYYTAAPEVTVAAPPASVNATATATRVSATSITVAKNLGGTNYASVPTVSFSGGNGTGLTATCKLGLTAESFKITSNTKVYTVAPTIVISGGGSPTTTATATAILSGGTSGTVTGITIIEKGVGYTTAPTLTFSGGTGNTGTAPTAVGNAAYFTVVSIATGGTPTGYTSAPTVTIAAPAVAVTATATATVSAAGAVTAITITNAGKGYSSAPSITIAAPATPVQATATANLTNGLVTSFSVGTAGVGYTSVPTVTVDAPVSGIQATATASIGGGSVTALTPVNVGASYPYAPSITIAAPPASVQATATATCSGGKVTAIQVTNGGAYYTKDRAICTITNLGGGVAATAAATYGLTNQSFAINSGDKVYSVAPTVTISAPDYNPTASYAVQATATAVLTAGKVTGITMNKKGASYDGSRVPTLTFSGGTVTSGTISPTAVGNTNHFMIAEVHVISGGTKQYANTTVSISAPAQNVQATAIANFSGGTITSYTITNPGKGYSSPPTVTVNAARTAATAIASLSNGGVSSYTITSPGMGYSSSPSVTVASPPAPVTATATSRIYSSGEVAIISVGNAGQGYTSAPAISFSAAPAQTTATATATVSGGRITGYSLTNSGSGYTSAPVVTVTAPTTPVTATATAAVSGGAVTGYTVTNAGAGYLSPPVVTVASPPTYTRATATAVVSPMVLTGANGTGNQTVTGGAITSITLTNAGTGYFSSPPNVTISAPTPSVTAAGTAIIASGGLANPPVSVSNQGKGYTSCPKITVSAPPAYINATANATVSNNRVSLSLSNAGSGYTATPTVSIEAPSAPRYATLSAIRDTTLNTITGVSIDDPGVGYATAPTIIIGPPKENITAQAQAVVAHGSVVGFQVTAAGTGYAAPPVVTVGLPSALAANATPSAYPLRTLMHINSSGTARLMSQAFLGTLTSTNRLGVTPRESMLAQDQKTSAKRFLSVHLPSSDASITTTGTAALGSSLGCVITTPITDSSNPFYHMYHPDHNTPANLYAITRTGNFTFTNTPPAGSTVTSGWGSTVIGGTYHEVIQGAGHYQDIPVDGTFELRRVSTIGTLTE